MFKRLSIGELKQLKSPEPITRRVTDIIEYQMRKDREYKIAKMRLQLREWAEIGCPMHPNDAKRLAAHYQLSPNCVMNEYGSLIYEVDQL